MELAITIAIVAAAAIFVGIRWYRSARRTLGGDGQGACGGDCEGCSVGVELRVHDSGASPPTCDPARQTARKKER